ncbi:MAG: acyl carrier protein [Candidatus Hodarchaeota archaeon]
MRMRVKSIIERVIEKSLETYNPSADSEERWDSLAHLMIMSEIERSFGISIPIEKIPELISLDDIVSYLNNNSRY